jgi:IclR family acetate operon transcriptional repressor
MAGKRKPLSGSRRNADSPVASVAKALATLKAFVDGQEQWGVRELAASLGEPPSTMHRVLASLRADGFVRYDRARQKYSAGPEFLRLSAAVLHRDGLRQAALPLLRQLGDHSGESCRLATFDPEAWRIAFIAEQEATPGSWQGSAIGLRENLAESAFGITVLAGLRDAERTAALASLPAAVAARLHEMIEEAERAGFALLRSGETGTATVAAAVRDSSGRPIGSIGMAVPLSRLGVGRDAILGEQVRNVASRLSQRLGAKILGGSSVGSWRDAVTLISELLSRDAPGLMVTPASGGGGQNLEDLDRGLGVYALTTASSLYDAYEGRGPFRRRHDGLRAVMNLADLQLFIITREGGAKDIPDALTRLRVSPGERGFSAAQLFDQILGMLPEGSRRRRRGEPLHFDYPEGRRQFLAGNVDVLFWLSNPSNALVQELAATPGTALGFLDGATVARLMQDNPGYRTGRVAQVRYPRWLGEDRTTLVVPTVLACRADTPDDEVHAVARSLYQHRAELMKTVSPAYGRVDAQFALSGLTAPLHGGAARFFQEIGAPVAASNSNRGERSAPRHAASRAKSGARAGER